MPTTAVSFVGFSGDHGDIQVSFRLSPADHQARSVLLEYSGACAGNRWQRARLNDETNTLAPGNYTFTWWSWDQEAGCKGEIVFRLITSRGETAESAPLLLDNSREGANGFLDLPLIDQGIQAEEIEAYERARDALIADPHVDFVATRRGDDYEVTAARGSVVFHRERTNRGYEYVVDYVEGDNPILNQEPYWFSSLLEELGAGANPNNVSIPKQGYKKGDPRLSFIEPEDDAYPYGYERIAAYFDHPLSADLYINPKGYSHAYGDDIGNHGSLNMQQSRSPLIFWGAGIQQGQFDRPVRQVDIAPTIAKLLGLPAIFGVDHRGIYSHDVYLGWQDGEVVPEVLNGGRSRHVLLLVLDGMTNSGLQFALSTKPEDYPNLMRLAVEGNFSVCGSIANYPSVTFPSHNVVGSGIYSGHHGLVDNDFYRRDTMKTEHPISTMFFQEDLFDPIGPGETLHQAIQRVYGGYDATPLFGNPNGVVTVSLMDPSVAGATHADLEIRDLTKQSPFPPLGVAWPPEIPFPDFQVGSSNAYFEEWTTMLAMVELYYLFSNGVSPVPTYTIFNFIATDGSGHANGPYGDDMWRVLKFLDDNLGVLFGWLDQWGLTDQITIVVTSDHGMELGDPSRSGRPQDALDDARVGYVPDTGNGVYLRVPVAMFDPGALTVDEEAMVNVVVTDEDNGRPIAGALVWASDGAVERQAVTDETGWAEFGIQPVDTVHVKITHPDYTLRNYYLDVQ